MPYVEFFPVPFLTALLILVIVLFRQRKRGWLYQLGLFLFGFYLMLVVQVIFFPVYFPENWPASLNLGENFNSLIRRVNLIPFYYGNMFSDLAAGRIHPNAVVWEILGNLVLTVPFGFFTGFFTHIRGRRILWLALGTGLALEGLQFLFALLRIGFPHSVDINDVLLNALGALIGFGLYRALERLAAGHKVEI